ncbi:MAG: DUF2258 domain-containing protein [Thermoprotei archaeon]
MFSEEPREEGKSEEIVENEVNTGIVIAGAYADKLRRTLFAQLRDYVKQNKEFAKEVARAAAEVNMLLYHILVESLKSDKGDAVRIRIKYRFDPREMKIRWDYDSLRIEFYKRQSDEEVNRIAREVMKQKLEEVMKRFAEAGRREVEAAEAMIREGFEEKKPVEVKPGVEAREEEMKPVTPAAELNLRDIIGSIDPIGETSEGGIVFKLSDRSGGSLGVASLESRAGEWIVDAIVIYSGKAYRLYGKVSGSRDDYAENPQKLLDELAKYKPISISSEDAKKLIEGKMSMLV